MKVLTDKPILTAAQLHLPAFQVGYSEDFETILGYLGLKTRKSTSSEWVVTVQDTTDFTLAPRVMREEAIPNVVGMGLKDALFVLENLGLQVVIQGSGTIRKQSKIGRASCRERVTL